MTWPLHIHGVGEGGQVCNWSANMPIAVRTRTPATAISPPGTFQGAPNFEYRTTDSCRLLRVEAPVCSGRGSHLPGLLGLRTIEERRGVIETTPDQAFLTFPGPEGYHIIWEPGALHLPLTNAPSGHLCVELDHFDRLDDEAGVPNSVIYPRDMTLFSGAGSRDDQRSARAEDSDLRLQGAPYNYWEWLPGGEPTAPTTVQLEGGNPWDIIDPEPQHQQQQRARCTFRRRHRRSTLSFYDRDLADLEIECGHICIRGPNPQRHPRGPAHDHEGECRYRLHHRNRIDDDEPG